MKEILIRKQTAGSRLDKAVMKYLDKATAGFVYKMLRKKNIVLNDQKAKGNELLSDGDVVKLYLSDDTIAAFHTEQQTKCRNSTIQSAASFSGMILYEDENFIAFCKPAGMLSQNAKASDVSADSMLKSYLGNAELFTPGISNRLDRNTSGLMLAGKNPAAVRELNRAIRDRNIQKLYLCITTGKISAGYGSEFSLTGFLDKDKNSNQASLNKDQKGSFVQIRCRVLAETGDLSLLQVDLVTGKSHQIRAQMKEAGYPIVGDLKYSDEEANRKYRKKYGVNRQLLHAWKVNFQNMNGILKELNGQTVQCSLPEDFTRVMKGEHLCPHGVQGDFGVPSLKN